ncbi:MAG: 3-deoxy-8-phosphooctulonate synthase, partial [Candidatus Makaraimicrobium thalassicum]
MSIRPVKIGDITIGRGRPLALIAGPCVIESAESAMEHARQIKKIAGRLDIPFIFK